MSNCVSQWDNIYVSLKNHECQTNNKQDKEKTELLKKSGV